MLTDVFVLPWLTKYIGDIIVHMLLIMLPSIMQYELPTSSLVLLSVLNQWKRYKTFKLYQTQMLLPIYNLQNNQRCGQPN
jgi:hypothetical protein